MEKAVLKQWQEKALDMLLHQNGRTVTWIIDPNGSAGKTWLTRYLHTIYGAFKVGDTRSLKLSNLYNGEQIIVFDYTRAKKGFNYKYIKGFKDGLNFIDIIPNHKWSGPCKVLVMSPKEPRRETLRKYPEFNWDLCLINNTGMLLC